MEPRRFVVLRHEPGAAGPRELHWDLMLEIEGSLRTWSLTTEPQAGEQISATELPRHRLDYLDYEGLVSHGRGSVSRLDCGTFDVLSESPTELYIDLRGERLTGPLRLTCDATTQRWIAWFNPT